MTADEIKALVERVLRELDGAFIDVTIHAQDAFALVKYVRDLQKERESLSLENQRLRLEFRADCEKQAEELYAMQRALTDIANADTIAWDDPTEYEAWAKSRARWALGKVDKEKP
jgi:vacuolar-type H+-ATPase subunit I/STV1